MSYCHWANTSEINKHYHDEEWGVPLFDDYRQFEFLMLEVMQCGLNWNLVIKKREIFRKCFDNFDYNKIATYNDTDVVKIMATDGMIKSQRKIVAVIQNARCFQKICTEYGSFCNYLWQYSDYKTILYHKHNSGYIPTSNGLSEKISQDMKKRGFKFLGPVVMYSHLQACGLINDHAENCPRYHYIISNYPTMRRKRDSEKQV